MKDISTNTLSTIISMASVVVMLIWGYIDTFEHSWLAVMIGGIIVVSLRMIRKDKEDAEKKKKEEQEQ